MVAVVDGQDGATLPVGHPVEKPVAVAVEDFDDLTLGPGVGKDGGVGEVGGGGPGFGEGVSKGFEEELFVDVVELRGAEDSGREGVGDFVGVNECLAVGCGEGGVDGFVPGGFVAEEFLLEFAEDGGAFDNVEFESEAFENREGFSGGVGEGAVAGTDLDNVADGVGGDPVGDGASEGGGDRGAGGEVGAAADVGDAGGCSSRVRNRRERAP